MASHRNLYWIKEILKSIFTFRAFVYSLNLWSYYIVNCEIGRRKAKIGKGTKIHPTVLLREPQNITIGKNCYFNHNTIMTAGHTDGKLIIGNNVQTGPNVGFFVANHQYRDPHKLIMEQGYDEQDIIIENDVWIGANSIITSGIRIGEGAVIGAGSVVTKNIPPYSIAAGTPAHIIKQRI